MKNILTLFCCILTTTTFAQNRFFSYSDGQKWGITNEKLEVLVAPQFDTEPPVISHQQIAIVQVNKKYGTIDLKGKFVIPCKYDDLRNFDDTYWEAKTGNKYTLVNRLTGKEAVPAVVFDKVDTYCYCGKPYMTVKVNGKMKFVNTATGKFIGKGVYDEADFFALLRDSIAWVITGNKYGMIDLATGKLVLPILYDKIDLTGKKGTLLIEATKGNSVKYFNKDGKPATLVQEQQRGVEAAKISTNAQAPASYDEGSDEGRNLHAYHQGNGSWKVTVEKISDNKLEILESYELNGYSVIEPLQKYFYYKSPLQGLMAVKNGKMGIIRKDGTELLPIEYDNIENFRSFFVVMVNGKKGVVLEDLSVLKKPVLKNIWPDDLYDTWLVEMPTGQKGHMDKKTGKIFIPGITE